MTQSKLIVGKVIDLNGRRVVETYPTSSQVQAQATLDHQRRMAALIAAAYLYRDEPNGEHRLQLMKAAQAL